VFHRGETVDLEIADYAFGGRGIARIPTEEGSYVVFIDNTFPGQLVKARIETKRKRHAEAKLLEVLRRSEDEVALPFQEISGGPYIYVPVELQEAFKKQSTLDVFGRIRRGTWWKVESLNKPSGLFDEEWETLLWEIREFLKKTGLPAWHPPKKEGFFRHIVVRKSFNQDQLLLNLVTSSTGLDKFDARLFCEFLRSKLGDRLAGFQHTINDNVADRAKIENGRWELVYGKSVVIEKLLGLSFEISMESFFQTNPKSAEKLYSKALDYVFEEDIPEGKVVMDLFCGTGTIGQILSTRKADVEIVGVDIVEEAIEDAKRNAKRNGIEGIKFYAADVGKFLKEHPEYIGNISTIILDPPRAGIAPKTLIKTIELGAKNIVYISCNPSTQARDAETLEKAGYKLEKISLVDQFPHTGHIESIAKFKKQ